MDAEDLIHTPWDEYPEVTPTVIGPYAVLYSWDIKHGSFPVTDWWTGKTWRSGKSIGAFTGPFETTADAEKWADKYENRPE